MTCIVGLVQDGVVYIGGDSAGVAEPYTLTIRADEKVFTRDSMIFGFSSSFRMGQLLRYRLGVPEDHAFDPEEYMATVFVDAVRECLKQGGFASRINEEERGGIFMVGYKGRLFTIESDYQVSHALDPFMAIGSGKDPALGALYATEEMPPRERVLRALEAAEHFNTWVRRPFLVVETPAVP